MKALLVLLIAVACGCVAPVNLNFESAKTLRKGQVDVQGNVSLYLSRGNTINQNYGGKLGYGISDTHTIKLRYEHLVPTPNFWSSDLFIAPIRFSALDYYEMENKFSMSENTTIGLALAYYSWGTFSFDPRYYVTFTNRSRTMDCTVIPKVHIFINKEYVSLAPSVAFGVGFSSDLDRWALRPEVGYDGYASYGVALTISLFSPKGKP